MTETPTDLVLRWGPIPGTAQETFFDDDTPDCDLLFTGGWASGKTMTLTAKALKLSAINAPLPGIWCVPDYAHIHDTILPTLLDADPDTGDPWFLAPDQCHYHETRHVLTWQGGGPIQFVTAENPTSIAGPNVAWAAVDEPGSIKHEAWRNTVARVRHPSARLRQRVAAGTPEGIGWLMDLFEGDGSTGHLYRMTTAENTELLRHNPAYLEQVRANASEAELAAYLDGKFVNMSGALAYPAFSPEAQMRACLADPSLPLRISFDFNVDPMTCVIGQQIAGPHGPEFVVVRSLALMASTVMDVCAKVVECYPRWPAGLVLYGDASGKARSHQSLKSNYDIIRELLAVIGPLELKVPKANPSVTLRLNTVNRLCRDARGIVRLWLDGRATARKASSCYSLVRSLQQTVKKAGTDDVWKKPGETVTHAGDALGYWLTQEAPAQKPMVGAAAVTVPQAVRVSQAMQLIRQRKSDQLRRELEALGHGV